MDRTEVPGRKGATRGPGLWAAGATLALALAGCEVVAPVEPVPRPPERPAELAPPPVPEPPAVRARPDPTSEELAAYYGRIETGFQARGLLRTDGGGPDTPIDSRRLADSFVRIALFEEYTAQGGRLVALERPSRLHRWERPISMQIEFGDAVPEAQKASDRADIVGYAARLSRVTGHPISQVSSGGNFRVYVVNEAERRALEPEFRAFIPGISRAALDTVIDLPRTTYCLVFALDPNDTGEYSKAVAVIRAETPDLLRLSCVHEEIAQGMGLANDSPAARPSVFNDDEEFALLTEMDEYMLRMLYDPRMRPGMDADAAGELARVIAGEYLDGTS
ncbi:DUF2927 domain-containing protein [Mesobaculum littorinae]|uniref:DUF2927 domain-containing protein n=1 Tax=Mesobaculum littorinae TaxID=2486419 RepID=A0A438AIT1_9RHOB|nr:DUF2927 domain-containing protein [Mesobaculum littorinae]RVV98592.1 DUF2927 domain-containing protein [Mesobaculum littorinae]